jgi:hypothetical protein
MHIARAISHANYMKAAASAVGRRVPHAVQQLPRFLLADAQLRCYSSEIYSPDRMSTPHCARRASGSSSVFSSRLVRRFPPSSVRFFARKFQGQEQTADQQQQKQEQQQKDKEEKQSSTAGEEQTGDAPEGNAALGIFIIIGVIGGVFYYFFGPEEGFFKSWVEWSQEVRRNQPPHIAIRFGICPFVLLSLPLLGILLFLLFGLYLVCLAPLRRQASSSSRAA